MPSGANQHTPELRRATRFPLDFDTICENRKFGEFSAKISNVSANGCQMVHDKDNFQKGDRVVIRLPVAGRIEAYLIWDHNGRSGFEFERVIRADDFMEMVDIMGYSEE